MVKVVHFAVETAAQEGHVADGLLVNSASYVGKQLKTDMRVPGHLCGDDHTDFYHDILGVIWILWPSSATVTSFLLTSLLP